MEEAKEVEEEKEEGEEENKEPSFILYYILFL